MVEACVVATGLPPGVGLAVQVPKASLLGCSANLRAFQLSLLCPLIGISVVLPPAVLAFYIYGSQENRRLALTAIRLCTTTADCITCNCHAIATRTDSKGLTALAAPK